MSRYFDDALKWMKWWDFLEIQFGDMRKQQSKLEFSEF